jgi:hypothetical protein
LVWGVAQSAAIPIVDPKSLSRSVDVPMTVASPRQPWRSPTRDAKKSEWVRMDTATEAEVKSVKATLEAMVEVRRTSLELNSEMMALVMVMKERSASTSSAEDSFSPVQENSSEEEAAVEQEQTRTSLDLNAAMMDLVMANKQREQRQEIEEAVSALHEVASQLSVQEWMERASDFDAFEAEEAAVASVSSPIASKALAPLSAARAAMERSGTLTAGHAFKSCRSLLSAVSSAASGSCADLQSLLGSHSAVARC